MTSANINDFHTRDVLVGKELTVSKELFVVNELTR